MKTIVSWVTLMLLLSVTVQATPPAGLAVPHAMGAVEEIRRDGIVVADQVFRIGAGTEFRDSAGLPQSPAWLRSGMRVDVFLYPMAPDSRELPTARRIVERP